MGPRNPWRYYAFRVTISTPGMCPIYLVWTQSASGGMANGLLVQLRRGRLGW